MTPARPETGLSLARLLQPGEAVETEDILAALSYAAWRTEEVDLPLMK